MGEIIKFCSNCNATFLESFTFCPTCANALAPFEMQPIPNMETTTPLETSPPIQSEPKENRNEFVYFSSAIPTKKVSKNEFTYFSSAIPTKKVSLKLGAGIVFMPYIFAWHTLNRGYSDLASKLCFVWLAVFLISISIFVLPSIEKQSQKNISSSTPKNDIGHSAASPTPAPPLSLKENPKTGKTTAKQSCAGIESELAGVEREQAGVENILNQTEDYSEEGTIKKSIYFNALKKKGQLQLQHIALDRKLKACSGKK